MISWRNDIAHRADLVREKLAGGPALRRDHAEMQRELEGLLARVEEVNNRIPDDPNEGDFLSDLTRLAREGDVAIEDFRRGATSVSPTHSAVTVTVNLRGSYRGVCGLIDGVAKLPRLAELTQLTLRRGLDGTEYAVSMTYALYYGLVTAADENAVATR
ncbi:type 4a pilus biogenesis protein PilO [Botrimarina colliarenosi]|uniref:type 4a pilus biogenesis protein PilO n=1 Tax=Botrimarina colliarenosi TaxID=2528001 RepID=UPI0018D494F3|nr:type 4a pilus biogenesis protein PilO [Botrimarina colliarenosi]